MGTTLEQLHSDSRQHCETCDRASNVKEGCVICDGKLLSYVNGKCPLGLWDHSAKIKHEPAPWPILARVIRRLRKPGERGIGDTIEAQLGAGGEWFKSAYKSLLGRDCGCAARRDALNRKFRY